MHSRQYGKFPGCSVNGKTIVKSFGDGLFIYDDPKGLENLQGLPR
jgi:hypothetical protein